MEELDATVFDILDILQNDTLVVEIDGKPTRVITEEGVRKFEEMMGLYGK